MGTLDGKVALVTGAAGGMGAACVERFADEGATVFAADVASVASDRGVALMLDVGNPAAWSEAIETISARAGRLDVLVNNAGILRRTPLDREDGLQVWDSVIRVNQLGVFLGMRAALPLMGSGGSIINVSSIDGMLGMAQMAAYVASKWAVRGMTKAAARELGPRGIRVNSIHPGYIETPMLTVGGRMTDATKASLAAQVPLGELGRPEDIAAVCAFLASEDSRYMSGAELVVDGGLISGITPS